MRNALLTAILVSALGVQAAAAEEVCHRKEADDVRMTYLVGKGEYQEPVAYLTKLRDCYLREAASAASGLGSLAFAQHDYEAARRHFEQAAALAPDEQWYRSQLRRIEEARLR